MTAERRPFPAPGTVRRVRIYDGPVRTLPQHMAHQRMTEDDEMSDDSAARRDAWRDAQTATTVTGERTQPGDAPREGIHEDHAPTPSNATDPSNAAPEATAITNTEEAA